MGFTGPTEHFDAAVDARGNIATEDYQTSLPGVFAAGGFFNAQVADAKKKKGEGDLVKLLNAGDTWEVK